MNRGPALTGLAFLCLEATAAHAADPLEPRLPWSPGGWTATNWLGFFLEVGLFLLVAALILRLGKRGSGFVSSAEAGNGS